MTNAEKFLKDGKATEELIGEMEISLSVPYYEVVGFWNKQIKPTLTEDERVILRNINKHFTHIYRLNNRLQVADGEKNCNNTILDITAFGHLFKFIKERRRIQYRGVVKR